MSGKPSIWTICSICSEEPYDGGDEPDDTGQNAKNGYRKGVADQ